MNIKQIDFSDKLKIQYELEGCKQEYALTSDWTSVEMESSRKAGKKILGDFLNHLMIVCTRVKFSRHDDNGKPLFIQVVGESALPDGKVAKITMPKQKIDDLKIDWKSIFVECYSFISGKRAQAEFNFNE